MAFVSRQGPSNFEIDTVKDFIQNKLTKLEADLQKIEKVKLQLDEEKRNKSRNKLVNYFNDIWSMELLNYMRAAHTRLEIEAGRGADFNFRERYNAMIKEKKMPPAGSGFYDLQGWFEALADQAAIGDLTVDQATENIRNIYFEPLPYRVSRKFRSIVRQTRRVY